MEFFLPEETCIYGGVSAHGAVSQVVNCPELGGMWGQNNLRKYWMRLIIGNMGSQ